VFFYDYGSPRDIVKHLEDGYRSEPFSAEDLVTGRN
jgi:hypothetical protein